ncbi:MAG TPA: ABC transporter substrate-binding protein, partial [Chloroflexota bacterium]|nr:ABC transporter substrate-binding protein [Chloroflexota bacterium]
MTTYRSRSLTRRGLLQAGSLLVGASALPWLAACSSSAPTPTQAPAAATSAPAATSPAPAATSAPAASSAPAAPTPTQPAQSTTVAAKTTAQPRSGGSLQVGRLVDIHGPADSLMANPSYILSAQIYNALIHYDEKYQPQPELAESWEISKDGKQVAIHLRQGVLFHTGREFTSDDVKYNTLRVRDPKLGMGQLKTMSEWITDIQTPDKYTVIYNLSAPRAAILDLLNFLFIVDRETAEGPNGNRKGVGTGPFAFAEWVPGDHLRFTKNPHYWVSGRPYLDEIVIKIIKDAQSLGVQLEAGVLNLAELLPEDQTAQYQKDSKYNVVLSTLSGQFYYIGINVTKPPLDNKLVRQAINHAIDR